MSTAENIAPMGLEELLRIGLEMKRAGLPDRFVGDAVATAQDFEGVRDLMVMWRAETEPSERDEIVADIQELIDDCSQKSRKEAPYIRFDDLEAIANDVRVFKNSLLVLVNERGGITHLANLTGMPQSSLSRFFNSPSMPRRGTLLKIAKALDLSAVQVATEWTRG